MESMCHRKVYSIHACIPSTCTYSRVYIYIYGRYTYAYMTRIRIYGVYPLPIPYTPPAPGVALATATPPLPGMPRWHTHTISNTGITRHVRHARHVYLTYPTHHGVHTYPIRPVYPTHTTRNIGPRVPTGHTDLARLVRPERNRSLRGHTSGFPPLPTHPHHAALESV